MLGSLFSPGTRLGNSIWVGGLLFLLAFGLPLLVAWGVWSGLRLRHWAARSVLYGVLALGVIGLCLWFVVSNPPQM